MSQIATENEKKKWKSHKLHLLGMCLADLIWDLLRRKIVNRCSHIRRYSDMQLTDLVLLFINRWGHIGCQEDYPFAHFGRDVQIKPDYSIRYIELHHFYIHNYFLLQKPGRTNLVREWDDNEWVLSEWKPNPISFHLLQILSLFPFHTWWWWKTTSFGKTKWRKNENWWKKERMKEGLRKDVRWSSPH